MIVPSSPVRTYHARAGRLGPASRQALRDLWPTYGLTIDRHHERGEWPFAAGTPVILEIGSGMGDATVAMASAAPSTEILAVEVHLPGVAALLRKADRRGLRNITVAHADAVEVLRELVPTESLMGIRCFFPDPWPKTRHHKRRLFRPDLVALMSDRLAVGGTLHAATDWAEYAQRMLAALTADPRLLNMYRDFAPRPSWRPVTRFESRGLNLGHAVRDVIFRRIDPANAPE